MSDQRDPSAGQQPAIDSTEHARVTRQKHGRASPLGSTGVRGSAKRVTDARLTGRHGGTVPPSRVLQPGDRRGR